VPDAVLAVDDQVGAGEAEGEIALANLVLREDVLGLLRVEDRRQRLGDELDPALELPERLLDPARQSATGSA
jgi:hypothetical protein